jgi:hypothetical protein
MTQEPGSENFLSKKFSKLQAEPILIEQIIYFYRGHGQYITEICRTMSDILFNWAFYLNGGGLIAIAAFVGTIEKISFCKLISILFLLFLFAAGTIFIIVAAHYEQKRFAEKGKVLEEAFGKFQNNEITAQSFFSSAHHRTKYDYWAPCLEKLSFVCGCSGILLGMIAMIFIKIA